MWESAKTVAPTPNSVIVRPNVEFSVLQLPSYPQAKNKGLITKTYEWDKEEVSSDEETEVKALMALADEKRVFVGKESASNGEWVRMPIQKLHTLLEIEDNDDRKSFLDYLCIDLNYVEEQKNNLLSKHINLIQERNTCKQQLLVLKQAKLDLITMQHVNTEILKKNQNLRNELKELTSIRETWLNSSNKVPSDESERNTTNHLVAIADSSVTDYDSADKSSVFSTPLPLLEKLGSGEPVSRPKTIKLILKSNSTLKAEILKSVIINEPSSTPAKDNISISVSKTNSAPASKLKDVKIEDDPPLDIVIKELNELKLQISKNESSYSGNKNFQQVPPNALQNKYKT
nr:retrovirus-related Pol polyprotein from transposon TNT 1-94 [Tanacetum cinerariifolium]